VRGACRSELQSAACELIVTEFNEGVRAFFESLDLARNGVEPAGLDGNPIEVFD